MDLNVVILTLQYSYLISSLVALHNSQTGLWQNHNECSQTLLPYSILSKHRLDIHIIDNMVKLRETTMMLNHNGIGAENHIKLIEPQLNNQLITVSINGNETFINNSRTEILKAYHQVNFRQISLTASMVERTDPIFLQKLDIIAKRRNVEILIDNIDTDFNGPAQRSPITSIFVLGATDDLNLAETEVRVLVDLMLDECFVDRITLPLSLIPSLGGSKLANFSEIANQLNINIYLPYLMPHVSHSATLDDNDNMSIWLTSKSIPEILFSKNIITSLIAAVDPRANAETKLFTQEIELSKEKLDLISLYHQNDVLSIMLKYGTFIQIPSLGEARNNKIIVQGQSKEAVWETAMEVSGLGTRFYSLDIKFLKGPTSADFEYYLINLINLKKTCVLTYNGNGMNIVGSKNDIKILLDHLVSDLQSSMYFTDFMNECNTKFQMVLGMELGNHHKEFFSGKKNGKIIKILNQLNHIPTIKFKYLNNYNFLINTSIKVGGTGVKNKHILSIFDLLVKSVNLVELELPAEMQFNIPEVFHKSIIGNGGQIIQSIMKKYNVFIKFSSSSHSTKKKPDDVEKERMLYMFKRNNNVLIKCPMKNLKSILFVKYELDQLVSQCCQNKCPSLNGIAATYNTADFKLLKSHYLLLNKKNNFDLSFVSDLEAEYNTYIDFPMSLQDFQSSSRNVTIKGNDYKTKQCAQKLAEMIPKSYEFQLTYCPGKFDELINEHNPTFREKVVIPFRLLLNTEIVTNLVAGLVVLQASSYHQIILSSYDDGNLRKAVSELTSYLREKRFLILDKKDMDFEPITIQNEVYSPSKVPLSPVRNASPTKFNNRSPTRSPTRSTQSPTRSPAKSPTKSPSKQPLQTITNNSGVNNKKNVPLIGLTPFPALTIPNFGW
ncbi:CIC11C00000000733 [Sungouiella intermedia]|uniref:CIC11C00000000733 n=1 Tax=Sungouiella intermedia TaxID=45354 RepID=A0A1L0CV86_9ASCO|nr:CIC11C00000000733 [[Candida] intermedia]